jgi:hypothetical protein
MSSGERRSLRRLTSAVLRTVAGYGLLLCAYLALNAVTHPRTLSEPLTHFAPWPTEGDTGAVCFLLSAAAFFVVRSGWFEPDGRAP